MLDEHLIALEGSQVHLEKILEGLNEGVVLFKKGPKLSDTLVVFFNSSALKLLGEASLHDSKIPLPQVFREPECMQWIESGPTEDFRLDRKDEVLSLRRKLIESENITYILITIEDITRRTRLEETRQKFISNMSHELKTPITSMSIALENILDGNSYNFQQNIGILGRSIERMKQLIEDLSDLSGIETAANLVKEDLLNLDDFTSEILHEFNNKTPERGISLVITIDPQLQNLTIKTNKLRLYQMVHNLLSNAFKYAHAKSRVQLGFSLTGEHMEIRVQDEGPGIALLEQERIFERFYRTSASRGLPGSGLGLSIVKQIANKLGGVVKLKSELGEGSVFTLLIPLS